MLRLSLQSGLLRALTRRADSRAFPLVVAGAALAAELSMSVPFASLLMAAVLLAPRRWVSIATLASLGAAVGALVLYLVFHHLGWNRLFAAYPDVVRSTAWRDAGDLHGILTQDLHRKLTHPKRLLGVALCGLFGGAFLLLGLGGAVLETIAIVAGFNNVAVVRQAVQ